MSANISMLTLYLRADIKSAKLLNWRDKTPAVKQVILEMCVNNVVFVAVKKNLLKSDD